MNWKGGKSVVICLFCKNEFAIFPCRIKAGRGKYCSKKCYDLSQVDKLIPKETRKKMSVSRTGNKHWRWKGENASYSALHHWVSRYLGKATKCMNGHKSKMYVWANVSGQYKRNLTDWHQLCQSCNRLDGVKIHPRFYDKSKRG